MYPKELVSETNKMMQLSAVDVFRKFQAFYSPLFDALVCIPSCNAALRIY